jgi:hypothetical protein
MVTALVLCWGWDGYVSRCRKCGLVGGLIEVITQTQPPTVMTSERYLGRYADDPSGLGTDAQWTFSLVPEQLHRAPLSTTIVRRMVGLENDEN